MQEFPQGLKGKDSLGPHCNKALNQSTDVECSCAVCASRARKTAPLSYFFCVSSRRLFLFLKIISNFHKKSKISKKCSHIIFIHISPTCFITHTHTYTHTHTPRCRNLPSWLLEVKEPHRGLHPTWDEVGGNVETE